MFNQGGYPWGPSTPIVYVPTPQPTGNNTDPFSVDTITRQIAGLEALKKALKEEKKEGGDKKKDEGGDLKIINMMLLMILVSPITGPVMSWFFHKGLSAMGGG